MSATTEPAFSHHLDVLAVADYLLSLDQMRPEPDVTPMKLAKLLYLAQSNYLASTGQRMFDDDVEAWDHGPVVHREWQRHNGRQIIATLEGDRAQSALPEDVTDFLDAVWARYGDRSANDLRRLTHEQAPWKDNYREGERRVVIPDEDMTSYFRHEVPATSRLFHPDVVLMPEGFLDDSDADAFAAKYAEFTGR